VTWPPFDIHTRMFVYFGGDRKRYGSEDTRIQVLDL